MSGFPITIATNGKGIAVTDTPLGAPAIVSTRGTPVVVVPSGGLPLSIIGLTPPGEWTPLNLGASLLAWWDASAGTTLAGSQVSAWADRKNGITVEQAAASSRPVYSATGFGGAPGIYFDGVDDVLSLTTHPFPIGGDASEIWAIVQQDRLGTETGSAIAVNYGLRMVARSSVSNVNRGSITGGATLQVLSVDLSSRHLMHSRFINNSRNLSVDQSPEASTSGTLNTAAGALTIGALSGNRWQGPIRDIIITLPLTTEQSASLTAFLLPRRML